MFFPSVINSGPCSSLLLLAIGLATLAASLSHAQGQTPSQVGSWSEVVSWPLVSIHTVLMPSGKVLMWDGLQVDGGSTARLWSPAAGTFEGVSTGRSDLFCAGHSALADGRILVVGGNSRSGGLGIRDVNIFDPQNQTWVPAGSMTFPRWYPTVTTLPDGRVLTISGADTCTSCRVTTPELYDPSTNSWHTLPDAALDIPLYPHLFVLPDGRIALTSTNEFAVATRVLDLPSQTWTMIDPRALDAGSAVMYRPGLVLKTGKSANADPPILPALVDAYVIDFNQPSPAWRQVASMAFPRAYHNLTVLPDGTVLVTGGGRTNDAANDAGAVLEAEIWSPTTEAWTTMASGARSRLYHSIALLLPDARVLVSGGGRFVGTNQLNAEIFSPPYLFKGARPTISSAPATISYGEAFSVGTPDSASIGSVSLIRLGANTHAFDHDQRFLPLTFTSGDNTLTVQSPANANLAPPGYYMLFIINAAGVPSVASILRVAGPPPVDSTPPIITGRTPGPGQTGVAANVTIQIGFSESISPLSATTSTVHLRVSGDTADVAATVSTSGSSISVDPSSVLADSTTYQVTVAGSITDLAGNPLGSEDSWTFTTAAANVIRPGLVAAYGFNEGTGSTLGDVTGRGHNGSISGAVWDPAGRFGGALRFDGVNDMVSVPDAAALDLASGMTVEAWVNPSVSANWRTIVLKEAINELSYALYSSDNNTRPGAWIQLGGSSFSAIPSTTVSVGTWTHLAGTYDGSVIRLFVNGSQVATRTAAGTIGASANPLRIGGNTVWGEYFAGLIDEIRLYDRALDAQEIQEDMVTAVDPAPGGPPPAPDTTITAGPPPVTALHDASFTFTSTQPESSFECRLDSAPLAACSSPVVHTSLAEGNHTFEVRAVSPQSGPDPSPASRSWSVDSIAPVIASVSHTTASSTAAVSWITNEPSDSRVTYGDAADALSSVVSNQTLVTSHAMTLTGLVPNRLYYYRVYSTDAAGNASVSPSPSEQPATFVISIENVTSSPAAVTLQTGTLRPGSAPIPQALQADDDVFYQVNSTSSGTRTSMWYGSFPGVARALSNLRVSFKGKQSLSGVNQRVYIWRWTTSSWVQLDSRSVGTSEILVPNLAPTGALSDYVSGSAATGELRVRVRGTHGTTAFFSSADMLQVSYDRPATTPALSVADASVFEGTSGTVNAVVAVTLSAPASQRVTASYATGDGSARAGEDYSQASGMVTFEPGVVTQNVTIPIAGDTMLEPDETFTLALQSPANATLGDSIGTITILNDDAPPDTASPTVIARTPNPGATDVALSANVVVQFSEPMAPASFGGGAFVLTDLQSRNSVTATVSVSGTTATLDPTGTMEAGRTYEATVSPTVTDLAGNTLGTESRWTFTAMATVVPSGLVAAYGMEEGTGTSVVDASGLNNRATISGATWTTNGRHGRALTFDGVNDRLNIADAASLDLTAGMTLSAWVLPTSSSGWRTVLLKEVSGGLRYALYAYSDTPRPSVYIDVDGVSTAFVEGPTQLPIGTWTHLASTYDGSILRLYVNGVEVASRTLTGAIRTSTGQLRIGGNAVWGEYFAGTIDEARVYNRALTPADIQAEMGRAVP